jgi:hypothetical protein
MHSTRAVDVDLSYIRTSLQQLRQQRYIPDLRRLQHRLRTFPHLSQQQA